jgi:hypothetical protein
MVGKWPTRLIPPIIFLASIVTLQIASFLDNKAELISNPESPGYVILCFGTHKCSVNELSISALMSTRKIRKHLELILMMSVYQSLLGISTIGDLQTYTRLDWMQGTFDFFTPQPF